MSIWDYLIPAFTGLIAGIFGHITGKRKSEAETKSVELDNAEKIIQKWEQFSQKMESRVNELELKVIELTKELTEEKKLRQEIEDQFREYRKSNV